MQAAGAAAAGEEERKEKFVELSLKVHQSVSKENEWLREGGKPGLLLLRESDNGLVGKLDWVVHYQSSQSDTMLSLFLSFFHSCLLLLRM